MDGSTEDKEERDHAGAVRGDRRGWMVRLAAVLVGFPALLLPVVSALGVFLDPLRRRKRGDENGVRVTTLDAIPPDGQPYRFPVISGREDAWNRYPPQPIGAVFLRRVQGGGPPKAYSAVCPHLGCSVDFRPDRHHFQCPCHNSTWKTDATRINPHRCPSPRDLDELDVEVRGVEVWVQYKRFRSGTAEKIEE